MRAFLHPVCASLFLCLFQEVERRCVHHLSNERSPRLEGVFLPSSAGCASIFQVIDVPALVRCHCRYRATSPASSSIGPRSDVPRSLPPPHCSSEIPNCFCSRRIRLIGSRSDVHRTSGTERIRGCRYRMTARKPMSYAIGTSNNRIRTRD